MEDLKNTREMTLVAEAYTRYRTLLVAYANKRTRNLADAEDVVQEAFIKSSIWETWCMRLPSGIWLLQPYRTF